MPRNGETRIKIAKFTYIYSYSDRLKLKIADFIEGVSRRLTN